MMVTALSYCDTSVVCVFLQDIHVTVPSIQISGPFTSPVTSYMKLTNPSEKKVCFKIKTTAPKKYCVRPNSGVLDTKGVIDVAGKLKSVSFVR